MRAWMIELQIESLIEKMVPNHEVARNNGIHCIQMDNPALGNRECKRQEYRVQA